MNQNHSLKKELNKNLFAKADTLVDKILSCLSIKLSNLHTSTLYEVETGVLLSDFAEHHCRGNSDILVIQFILLDAAGISPALVLNEKSEPKREQAGSLSK